MSKPWHEIAKDPEFQSLGRKQQDWVREKWFQQNVAGTKEYKTLSDEKQREVRAYMNFQDPAAQEILNRPIQQQTKIEPATDSIFSKTTDFLGEHLDVPPFVKTAAEAMREDAMQNIGGMAGEIAGAKFGLPAVGAAVGGGIGKGVENIYQSVTGSPFRPRGIDWIKDPFFAAVEEAAYTKGSDIALRSGKRLLGAPTHIKNAVPDAIRLGQAAEEVGTHLLPDQLMERGLPAKLTGVAEASLTGGRVKRLRLIEQPAALRRKVIQTMKDMFGRTDVNPGDLANLVNDNLTGSRQTFRNLSNAMYQSLSDMTEGVTVNIKPIKKIASEILKDRKFLGELGAKQAGVDDLARVLDLKDNMTFAEAHQARSAVLDIIRDLEADAAFTKSAKPRAHRNLNKIASSITGQMDAAAKKLSPDAHRAWKDVNTFYAQGEKEFGSKMIRDLARAIENESAERIMPLIFNSGSIDGIKTLRKHISPAAWSDLKAAYIADTIRKTSGMVAGDPSRQVTMSGKAFLESLPFSNVPSGRGMSKEMFELVFDKQERAALKELGDLGFVMQMSGDGTGKVAVQLQQMKGVGEAMSGLAEGKAGLLAKGAKTMLVTFSGMDTIAYLMTKPKTAKLFTESVNAPRGSLHAVTTMLRIKELGDKFTKEQSAREKRKRDARQYESGAKPFGRHF